MVMNWYIVLIIVVLALIILFVIYKLIRCIATNQTTAGEAMDSAANLAHAAGDANLKVSDVVNPVANLIGAAGTCLIIKLEAFKRKWGFKNELAIISQPKSSTASSTRLSRPARSSIKNQHF
jgi:p-aminobenzoyl-glutamate transporter AbgT